MEASVTNILVGTPIFSPRHPAYYDLHHGLGMRLDQYSDLRAALIAGASDAKIILEFSNPTKMNRGRVVRALAEMRANPSLVVRNIGETKNEN